MADRITVYDIAKEAGYSAATVSRVLTGNVPVKEKTRQRILEVLERHDFKPSALARSLKERRSKTIGFIVPDITNPFFSQIFLEVEMLATRSGYTVILCNSQSDYGHESQLLDMLVSKEVEAIVFAGGRIDALDIPKKLFHEVESVHRRVPLILCSALPGARCFQVMSDDRKAMHSLVEHLHALGHRTLGMVGGHGAVRQFVQRRTFLLESAKEFGMAVKEPWLVEGGFNYTGGQESMARLLRQKDLPTAVIAFNDVVAIGALACLERHGFVVPRDMALAGFDGIALTESVNPALTTMVTDFRGFAEKIMEIVDGREECDPHGDAVLEMRLAVRGSTDPDVVALDPTG